MKFGYVVLYVPDVAAAVEFYENVFGLHVLSSDASGEYAEMQTGETRLVFAAESLSEEAGLSLRAHRACKRPAAGALGFVVDDVEAAFAAALKAGAVAYETPKRRAGGETFACVRDLNGVLVEIGSPEILHQDEAWRFALRG